MDKNLIVIILQQEERNYIFKYSKRFGKLHELMKKKKSLENQELDMSFNTSTDQSPSFVRARN